MLAPRSWTLALLLAFVALAFAAEHAGARRVLAEPGTSPAAVLRTQMKLLRSKSRVLMSPLEQAMIEEHLQPEHTFLEWGSGYSTLWFSQFVSFYGSIEHHTGWYNEMKEQLAKRTNVRYVLAGVADGYKGWGGGVEEGTYEQFENYVKAADQFTDKVQQWDRVLIDGRARTSCAEFILKYLKSDSIVFIHDYMPRSNYHGVVHQYYHVIAASNERQSLVVLRPKAEAIKAAQAGEIIPDGVYKDLD